MEHGNKTFSVVSHIQKLYRYNYPIFLSKSYFEYVSFLIIFKYTMYSCFVVKREVVHFQERCVCVKSDIKTLQNIHSLRSAT